MSIYWCGKLNSILKIFCCDFLSGEDRSRRLFVFSCRDMCSVLENKFMICHRVQRRNDICRFLAIYKSFAFFISPVLEERSMEIVRLNSNISHFQVSLYDDCIFSYVTNYKCFAWSAWCVMTIFFLILVLPICLSCIFVKYFTVVHHF